MNENTPCKQPDYKRINFRVSEYEYNKFVEVKQKLRLSARKFIEQLSSQPCNAPEIIIYNKRKTKSITLPKNFLKRDEISH